MNSVLNPIRTVPLCHFKKRHRGTVPIGSFFSVLGRGLPGVVLEKPEKE